MSPVSTPGSSGRGPGKAGFACSAEMGDKGRWEGSKKTSFKRFKRENRGLWFKRSPPATSLYLPWADRVGVGDPAPTLKSKGTEIHLGSGKMKIKSSRRLVPISHLGHE